MKITQVEISEYKQNRDKFNKYYNDAVLDILLLNHNFQMSIKEIQNSTPYDINFIVHVIENYDIDTEIDDEDSYYLRVKVNKYNINIQKLKEFGYHDNLIAEMLNPSKKGVMYTQRAHTL